MSKQPKVIAVQPCDPISNVFVALPINSYHGAREGVRYECRNDKNGWRCGKCLRGLVAERLGDKCKVCGAEVVKLMAVIQGPIRGTITCGTGAGQ